MIPLSMKVALRNLTKHKVYSFINIAGLAAGMAIVLLISLWIWDEVTFNHYHLHHARLAQLRSIETFNGSVVAQDCSSVPLATALNAAAPDDITQLSLTSEANSVLTVGDSKLNLTGSWAQADLPAMLSLHMIEGSVQALKDPTNIMISNATARSLFPHKPALHQTIRIDDSLSMQVGGVYADIPAGSNFEAMPFLLSWENASNPGRADIGDWYDHHFNLYLLLRPGVNLAALNARVRDISKAHLPHGWEEVELFPMDNWHLYNATVNGKPSGGAIQFVWLFAIVGSFILLLACINFINLSTARSEQRAKEVGIRKAIGSLRGQLIVQFLGESMLTTAIAMLVSVLLAQLFIGQFNTLSGKTLSIPYGSGAAWLILLAVTGLTGLVAGIYPAFYLSGFQPIRVLKGAFRSGANAALPRKILVVVQFTISITLIIATLIVYHQVEYAKSRPAGYSKDKLLTVYMDVPDRAQHYDALRNDLLKTGVVDNMAESSSPATEVRNSMLGYDWKGRDPSLTPIVGTLFVTYDFGKTIRWQLLEGRDFSREHPADSGAFILNETAARFIGYPNPVGQTIRWHNVEHPIVGLVRDMVMESPYAAVQPTFFTLQDRKNQFLSIRLKESKALPVAFGAIEKVLKQYNPDAPFDFSFTDDAYSAKFLAEDQVGRMVRSFSVLAIFISALGLFGLASFVTEQRRKEIGLRKVLGASVFSLWRLLSKEFVWLVLISCCIAVPVAAYAAHRWLEQFQYRTALSWWIFFVAGSGALIIALLTVSYQSLAAAYRNPVESLRAE